MIETILGSKSKIKLLRVFYRFPQREFCLGDLVKILGCSTGTIYPSLSDLVDSRIILSRKMGRSTLYRLNAGNPLVKKITEIFETEGNLLLETAREFVKEIDKKGIVSVVLFGSVATGKAAGRSDIDLLIVFGKDRKDVEKKTDVLVSEYLGKDIYISPVLYSKKEVKDMMKRYNSFITRVQEEGILLFGTSLKKLNR